MKPMSICDWKLPTLMVSLAALCLILCVGPNVVASSPDSESCKFTPIDYPDAVYIVVLYMNLFGQSVGIYEKDFPDGSYEYRCFFLSKSVFTPTLVGDLYTEARGINVRGEIVGAFGNDVEWHGFLLRKGEVTQIDYPGADTIQPRINKGT
jgi:hypothetical protein